jgi:dipeptidyl aminopeptidase/acylaminoacyl peptidase
MRHLRWLVVSWLILSPIEAPAQTPALKRAITIDDYFTQADLFQVAYAKEHIAYTEGRWQESTDDRKTDLWIVPRSGADKPRRLTADRAGDRSPQFSPDGAYVYFLGNRTRDGEKRPPYDGKTQVWRSAAAGQGGAQAVTRLEGGVEAYELSRDGKSLYYLVHVDKIQDDWSGLRSKYGSLEYGHGQNRLGQIWKLDLASFRTVKLIEPGRNIREFAVAPNGRRIAMITTPDDKVVSFEGQSRVDVWDAATGKLTKIPEFVYRKEMPSPYAWLDKIAWNTAGDMLAFGVIFDGYPAEIVIAELSGKTPTAFKMPRPDGVHVKGYGTPLQWVAGKDDLLFLAEEKGRVRLCVAQHLRTAKEADLLVLTKGDVVVEGFEASTDLSRPHDFAAIVATPTQLPDVYVNDDGGSIKQISDVNPQAASWKLPRLSVVTWKGAGGHPVDGILELPPDYKQGDKVPLVVEIHGGPTTATYFKQQYWIYGRTLLPAQGYAVLCPNYRGSTGYGDKFTTDLIGHENDIEVEDILKGVDAMVERGIADPNKLAVTGWSNGGYLTNCLITKTPRFKAAISGAGIVDAIMEWGSNDEPAYAMVFKQGLPWTNPEKYHKASPTYQLGNIKTPTLIHVGGNDDRCPPGHSKMLYRTLKEYLHVPTELIVYPGEGHGLSKYRNRRAKLEWDLAWLRRHLAGNGK